jgi:hypothetical protein
MRPGEIRGNVFVANLPRGFTDAQLAEAFDPYGIVLSACLARDPATGETLGHGLVQLAPDRGVEGAVSGVNETGIAGRRIEARRADPDMGISPPRQRDDRPRPFGGGASGAGPPQADAAGVRARDHPASAHPFPCGTLSASAAWLQSSRLIGLSGYRADAGWHHAHTS